MDASQTPLHAPLASPTHLCPPSTKTRSSAMAQGLRDALLSIEKSLQSINDYDIHPRSSQLLLLNGRTVQHRPIRPTSCLWTVVSMALSRTFSRHVEVNVTACDLENSFIFDNET